MTVGASRMRVMLDAEQGRAGNGTPTETAPASTSTTATPSVPPTAAEAAPPVPDAATPTFTAAAVVEQASGG